MDWDRFSTTLASRRLNEREPSITAVLDVVTDDYSRYSLYSLAHDPNTTLSDLADFVTGFEAMRAGRIATTADHERVRIRLYHAVLPKFDALGYVDFDPESRRVESARLHDAVNASLGTDA